MTGSDWKPTDTEETIRRIIRATVSASGAIDPDDLPHLVRRRLKGQVGGEVDVDAYIKSVLKEMKEAGEG